MHNQVGREHQGLQRRRRQLPLALSDLIADYGYTNARSSPSGRGRSRQQGKESIFDLSNLPELDRGRAVVLASGAPANHPRLHLALVHRTHRDAVEASFKADSQRHS